MSRTHAESFVDLLLKNESLRQEVLTEQRDDDSTLQRLCQLGGRQGLSFTESEFVDAWKRSQSTDQSAISDAELDGVTGGTTSLSKFSSLMRAACKGTHIPDVTIEL